MSAATTKPAPAKMQEVHLLFLDELREIGITNMYGARPYLMEGFHDLTKQEAADILMYWMSTFSDRHPRVAA